MQEQRLTIRLRSYWDQIRKTNPLPDIRHFNKAAVEDLWPNCFTVALQGHGRVEYKYDYMGQHLVALYGSDLTGRMVEERSPDFPGMVIFKKLEVVARSGEPLLDEGSFLTKQNKLVKYRACILPYTSTKGGLTHIMVGLSYRAF